MTSDDIRLLYEYERWANRRVLKAASTLSDEQFTRAMSGSFHCVRDTLLHISAGGWIWLAYWRNPPDSPASLSDLKAKRDDLFSPEAFPNVNALQSKWIEVELEQAEFVNRVNNKSLAKPRRITLVCAARISEVIPTFGPTSKRCNRRMHG